MAHSHEFWPFEITADSPEQSGLLLARPDVSRLFILNQSAAFLWSIFQALPPGAKDAPGLLSAPFARHFGISPSQAATDVTATFEFWSQALLAPPPPIRSVDEIAPLDNLKPREEFIFSLGAASFRVVAYDPDFAAEIRPRLSHLPVAPLASPSPAHLLQVAFSPGQKIFTVFREGILLQSVPDAASARVLVLEEISRLAYEPNPEWLAILHAAALANPATNQSVILPAATNSGKSTLTAALLHSGLRLLSDDSAAIATDGQVLAAPFPLMLRSGSWPVLAPYFPQLSSAPIHIRYGQPVRFLTPPAICLAPSLPQHLVFVNYSSGVQTELEPLSHLQTLYQLQESGFWVPHTRSAIGRFIEWLRARRTYRLRYSNLSDAISVVHDLLAFKR